MEKIKVLYYNTSLLKGGTDTYMLEVVKNINHKKFQVDVVIKDGDKVDEFMFGILEKAGAKVYLAKGSLKERLSFIVNVLKQNKGNYQVMHINATSPATGIIAYYAKKYGKIKKVIFHSHMGGNDNGKGISDLVGSKMMFKYSDKLVSCSNVASIFMFGQKYVNNHEVKILNNSVDLDKFDFNKTTRKKVRAELGISDKTFVVLHVGRFAPQKNHKLLVDVFSQILKKDKTAKLMLIGDGVLLQEVYKQVKLLKIEKSVLFMGLRNNVEDFMQAADCFVMTSLHEGLPIVAVESQASGLPCVFSSNISHETKLCDNVNFVGLDEPLKAWANTILASKRITRVSTKEILEQRGFDKKSAIKKIEKLYSE